MLSGLLPSTLTRHRGELPSLPGAASPWSSHSAIASLGSRRRIHVRLLAVIIALSIGPPTPEADDDCRRLGLLDEAGGAWTSTAVPQEGLHCDGREPLERRSEEVLSRLTSLSLSVGASRNGVLDEWNALAVHAREVTHRP